MFHVAIPVIIFVACLSAGVYAATRWLPSMPDGPAGGLAFFAACGLLGGALAVVGLHVYQIVEETHNGLSGLNREIVANNLDDMVWEGGLMLGLAAALYLLAPSRPSVVAPSAPSPVAGTTGGPASSPAP